MKAGAEAKRSPLSLATLDQFALLSRHGSRERLIQVSFLGPSDPEATGVWGAACAWGAVAGPPTEAEAAVLARGCGVSEACEPVG
jgi:hypothetical protein